MEFVYTYRHNTVRDPLTPFTVRANFVFPSTEACRKFVAQCLDDKAPEYVVVEGAWDNGTFTGARVVE